MILLGSFAGGNFSCSSSGVFESSKCVAGAREMNPDLKFWFDSRHLLRLVGFDVSVLAGGAPCAGYDTHALKFLLGANASLSNK